MKNLHIDTHFEVYESIDELPGLEKQLMHAAVSARAQAYAPYSEFSVGAAVLLENSEIITGSNQENAAYPSGLCAERTAVFYASSQFPDVAIQKIAITAGSIVKQNAQPIPPCGACRQALAEYEVNQGKPIEVLFMGETGKVVKSVSVANLLPLMFDRTLL